MSKTIEPDVEARVFTRTFSMPRCSSRFLVKEAEARQHADKSSVLRRCPRIISSVPKLRSTNVDGCTELVGHNVNFFDPPFKYGLLCYYLQTFDASMGSIYLLLIVRRILCTIAFYRTHHVFIERMLYLQVGNINGASRFSYVMPMVF